MTTPTFADAKALIERMKLARPPVSEIRPSVGKVDPVSAVYSERNKLVAALTHFLPAHLMPHPNTDVSWDPEWRWIVCVDGPTGQMTWHIHDSELPMFDHLGRASVNTWDGHTTEEKYERLAELTRRPTRAGR